MFLSMTSWLCVEFATDAVWFLIVQKYSNKRNKIFLKKINKPNSVCCVNWQKNYPEKVFVYKITSKKYRILADDD